MSPRAPEEKIVVPSRSLRSSLTGAFLPLAGGENAFDVSSSAARGIYRTTMNFRPSVAIITGASAGVGRAAVQRFAREGVSVGLLARGRERLDSAVREAEALGVRALPVTVDVADAAAVDDAASTVEEELGPIDVWVNNAMATGFAPFKELTAEEYRRATEVTYLGTVWGTMAALRRMLPRDRGTI